ncbi:hypothetical protein VTH06DRAFT_5053 [Thermothelomyces fergusii]
MGKERTKECCDRGRKKTTCDQSRKMKQFLAVPNRWNRPVVETVRYPLWRVAGSSLCGAREPQKFDSTVSRCGPARITDRSPSLVSALPSPAGIRDPHGVEGSESS